MILTNLLLAAIFLALLYIGDCVGRMLNIQRAYLLTAPPAVTDAIGDGPQEETCCWYHTGGGDLDKPCRNYRGGKPPR
jgi:hypothetical protein